MASVAHIIRRRRARRARLAERKARGQVRLYLLLALLVLLVGIPAGVTVGGAALTYGAAVRDLPAPEDSLAAAPTLGSTELYDRGGTTLLLVDQADSERAWLSLQELPPYLVEATLLSEDPDFRTTARFDLLGTFSRLWENLLFGPLALDASLTGRLVRNVVAPPPEVITADYIGREIALVAELQRRYSPDELLEWHLNTNDYGNRAYGIEAAAQTYLGKSARSLSVDEAALLAAIPLATQYNPFDNETAARGRQLDLLRQMRAASSITPDEFDLAAATLTPILIAADQPQQIAPEFVAYARRQAQDILDDLGRDGARLVARGNLRIITTLDLDLYYQSECALQTHLARLAGRAASPDARNGQPCVAAASMPLVTPLPEGLPDTAALVVLDVATGEIRSMVGAASVLDDQPGPTLLPFVYFAALLDARAGFNPARMVLDIPGRFPGAAEGLIYAPVNPDGRYRGPLNLRDAMSAWLLPPAVQVANNEGMDTILRYAHRIGLNSLGEDGRYDLSLLERGGAVSVLDMGYAYSVFAAQGAMRGVPTEPVGRGFRQRNPVAVLRIEDADGNVLWQYDAEQVELNAVGVFDIEVGYLMNDILADSDRRRAMLGDNPVFDLPRPTTLVNGVTSDRADNWAVGYTPQLVTAVHIGRADGGTLGMNGLAVDGAAVVWRALTQYAHERDGLPPAEWPRPEAIVELPVCERSGLLPNGVCPARNEIFIALPGYQPAQTDTYWQTVEINSSTGQRATTNTPSELRVANAYFIPPPEAEDWWRANNLPLPPTQYDTVSLPELFSTVQILQPQSFAYVGGVVDIRGTLDPSNLLYYQLSVGQGQNPTEWIQIGEQQTSFTQGATLGTWDTGSASGLYNILLRVVRQDNSAETATVQVTVDNTAPTVTLTAGEPGRIYRWPSDQQITLEAQVDDDYSVERVEFYQNGQLLGIDQEWPYGFDWTITRTGEEQFSAVAFDAVGNAASSDVTVTVERG